MVEITEIVTKEGGAGSGNFGHAGRPGEVGGSGEGGGGEGEGDSGGEGGGGEGKTEGDSGGWASGLRPEQQSAIAHFTGDFDYRDMRDCQAGRDAVHMKDTVTHWESAVDSAPTYEGECYRGLANLDDKTYGSIVGSGELTWDADSSASPDLGVTQDFVKSTVGKNSVLFKVQARSAKDITDAKDPYLRETEKEVIMRKGTSYKVASVK